MLFNSALFIGGFLPVVLAGFLLLAGMGRQRAAALWLMLASFVFYGWWNPAYVPLLAASILFNYLVGGRLIRHPSRPLLVAGIAANVLMLGYYKYTGFLVETLEHVAGTHWSIDQIVLPLAISFFTFQQIAYLVDAHAGVVKDHDLLDYALFITFFPQLIAGPITHHGEMMEQFRDRAVFRPRMDAIALGLTVFLVGLFKKVVFADPLGERASPVFAAAADGAMPGFGEAWGAALNYTLQIYFDFSGYSDMAIGLGLLFGIALPANFDSPFKARNVIEYWSRWHMTLTRFLTAYLYNPIVLRITRARMAAGRPLPRRGRMSPGTFVALLAWPTLFTMFVSGVWHGAGWQFLVFGLLHGLYLVVAHGWRAYKASRGRAPDSDHWLARAAAVLTTFVCVVVAMVFFRAADVPAALSLLAGMAGLHGAGAAAPAEVAVGPLSPLQQVAALVRSDAALIVGLLAVVWTLPNTQQWMRHYRTALDWHVRPGWMERWSGLATWRPAPALGAAVGVAGFFALALAFSAAPTEFLYFQF
ncbi:MBOAT family O-acyltransferase [Coralloluteibacterium stylophorae]|uniref:Probable alginate O-acetylase n=1 Tax=Coralloluteibacterium stylophorae TaxID=1776034 RepID=A0A8J7VUI9_9GAMM|nr:MBOAT family O-acyltransferase [Coralloluteibacterium stylophorae]MBS7457371.1 MBOAT family protein [Coralloluteibacterium stylophorae]